MRRYPILLALLAAVFAGCAGMMTLPSELEAGKVNAIMKENYSNPELVFIDVRSVREYDEGHLERALNIPVETAVFRPEMEKLDRGMNYVLYCRSGNRARDARDIMRSMGFEKVTVMTGGILAWERAGFRTVRDEE